jgi:hypothetical protein
VCAVDGPQHTASLAEEPPNLAPYDMVQRIVARLYVLTVNVYC